MENTSSGILHMPYTPEGSENPILMKVYPENTVNEVMYDLDNEITLKKVLDHIIDYHKVDSVEDMYKISNESFLLNGSSDTTFNTPGSADHINSIQLTSNTFLIAYQDTGNTSKGTVLIVTNTDNTLTVAEKQLFTTTALSSLSLTKISDSQAIVFYTRIVNTNQYISCARVINIASGVITFGSENVFITTNSAPTITSLLLAESKVIALYKDSSNNGYGTSQIFTINPDSSITAGSKYVFYNGEINYINGTMDMGGGRFLVIFASAASNNFGMASILTITNNTTMLANSPSAFTTTPIQYISCAKLMDNKYVVFYRDAGNNGYGTLQLINITMSNAFNFGRKYVIDNTPVYYTECNSISNSKVLLSYTDTNNGWYGTAQLIEVVDDAIYTKVKYSFNNYITTYIKCIKLSDTTFLEIYASVKNDGIGAMRIITIQPSEAVFYEGSIINVNGVKYRVIDLNKISGPDGYEILCSRCNEPSIDIVTHTISEP